MEFLIFLGVVALIVVVFVLIYNRLVALRVNRDQAFSDIDVQLKQRFNLVPQLVETVKGYAQHEKDIFQNVSEARARVRDAGTGNTAERMKAEGALGGALVNLLAVVEAYPDLKADANFQQLMNELSDIENKIAAARRFFNNSTSEYNSAVQQVPANIIAGLFGFKTEAFFEVEDALAEQVRKAPEVNFTS